MFNRRSSRYLSWSNRNEYKYHVSSPGRKTFIRLSIIDEKLSIVIAVKCTERVSMPETNNHYGLSQFIFVSFPHPRVESEWERERDPRSSKYKRNTKKIFLLIFFSFFVQLVDIWRECLCISNVNKVCSLFFFDKYFSPDDNECLSIKHRYPMSTAKFTVFFYSLSLNITFERLKTIVNFTSNTKTFQ